MSRKRSVEVFSAGCPTCDDVVERVREAGCPSCGITVHDMNTSEGSGRARELGVHSLPAVAIDGDLADCCSGRGPDLGTLRAAGLGQPAE